MKTLLTTNGYTVLLDDEDWERFVGTKWFYERDPIHCRVYSSRVKGRASLHRLVLQAPPDQDVHHKDQDPLNNQRDNLELVPKTDHGRHHMLNSGRRKGFAASPYKGICHYRGRWRVVLKHEGQVLFLGDHETEEEAALVYDAAVLHYRQGEGYLNLLTKE